MTRLSVFILGLALRVDRRRTITAMAMMLVGLLSGPLYALGAMELIDACLDQAAGRAVAIAALTAVLWLGTVVTAHLLRPRMLELGDKLTVAVETELIDLGAGSPQIAHIEDPAYADQLELLRAGAGQIPLGILLVIVFIALLVQIALTCALLGLVSPVLIVLPAFAVPGALAGRWADGKIEAARVATAQYARRARHLLELLTAPPAAKELRIFGLAEDLRARQTDAWNSLSAGLERVELRAAAVKAAAQIPLALAFAAALVLVVDLAVQGKESAGSVLLTIALAARINLLIGNTLIISDTLRGLTSTVERFQWLRTATGVQRPGPAPDRSVPSRIDDAIALENVTFTYPGTDRPVLRDVSLSIPAGSIVAIVGENGAGKTTLGKLLCRLYEPSEGRINVDGTDLSRLPLADWRSQISATFQDHARFELLLRETVAVGQLVALQDRDAVTGALERASASDVPDGLPAGLETPLGRDWHDGVELSGGQWQKLALARSMMRSAPLLLLLDEPTAALDAHAEHALFERYAAAARRGRQVNGGITVLVSHRFSTVRMADLIVVLDHGRIIELGSHAELIAAQGLYAELFQLQAAGYA